MFIKWNAIKFNKIPQIITVYTYIWIPKSRTSIFTLLWDFLSEVLIQILVDSYLIDWFFPQLFKSLLDLGGFRCIAVCWGIISDPILHWHFFSFFHLSRGEKCVRIFEQEIQTFIICSIWGKLIKRLKRDGKRWLTEKNINICQFEVESS